MADEQYLYSVRMRASGPDGRHLSGAERIVGAAEWREAGDELLQRAQRCGEVAHAQVSVDRKLASQVHLIPCLPVTTVAFPEEFGAYLGIVGGLLDGAAGAGKAIERAYQMLTDGPAVSGALLLDAGTGDRIAECPANGVRARHLDYEPGLRERVRSTLRESGLVHSRTHDALALASKMIWAGVAAELCWSDDPDYNTGYIATREFGYVRIPRFKPLGAAGGRILFLRGEIEAAECIQRLREEWTLVDAPPGIRSVSAPHLIDELAKRWKTLHA
jgi:6-carboxyhexanoate--CoA ligase